MNIGAVILYPITCVLWLIVGALAGSLANRLVGTGSDSNLVPDIVLGLIGAVVGGIILSFLGLGAVNGTIINPLACIGHLLVATFGASVLILVGRLFMGRRVF